MTPSTERPVLTLAELEAFDRWAPEGGTERRFCCPMPRCEGKRVDPSHRSLSVNTETGAWRCHRCSAEGKLRERWAQPTPTRMGRSVVRRAFSEGASASRLSPRVTMSPSPQSVHKTMPTTTITQVSARSDDWRTMYTAACTLDGTPGAAYLAKRGISSQLAAAAGVRFAWSWYGRPAVVFPDRQERRTGGRRGAAHR